jgi:hypothetical protein
MLRFFALDLAAGLPDFSLCMIPKLIKCTKLTHMYVPNGHNINEAAVK